MKAIKRTGLILGLVGLAVSCVALADPAARHGFARSGRHGGWGGGWHGGVIIGAPLFWPYYGVPYAPVVISPAVLPEYIEQSQEQATTPPLWYFCKDPKGYYPYVKQCHSGWQTVVPPAPSSN